MAGENQFFCYIVRCTDGTLYTGWTTDPQRRCKQHNLGSGAKYTRMHRPVELVYTEHLSNRSEAMKREFQIKHMKRAQKEKLISRSLSNDGN